MTGAKLAYAAAVLGASSSKGDSAAATRTNTAEKAAPTGDSAERSTGSPPKATTDVSKDDSTTPSPAETAERQKLQQDDKADKEKPERKDSHNGSDDGGKKSAWKKPDADVPEPKENITKDEPNPESKQRSNNQKKKKDGPSNSSSSSSSNKNKKGGNSPNNGTKKQFKSKQQGGNSRQNQHQGGKKKSNNGNKKGEKGGQNANVKKNTSRKKKKSKGQNQCVQPQPLSPAEFEQLKMAVVCQVEYFFSDDELSRNTYLRRHMDVEGYIPAAMIFNFPSIAAYCFNYYDLLAILSEKTSLLEIDQDNETLRRKDDYQKWLCPNGEGGVGCPRWIKEQPQVDCPNPEPSQDKAEARKADDASYAGSNATPDTDSCTDSENLDHADGIMSS